MLDGLNAGKRVEEFTCQVDFMNHINDGRRYSDRVLLRPTCSAHRVRAKLRATFAGIAFSARLHQPPAIQQPISQSRAFGRMRCLDSRGRLHCWVRVRANVAGE